MVSFMLLKNGQSRLALGRRFSSCFLAACCVTLLFFVIGLRWIWLFRYGQPLDIDEAGYLSIAFNDYNNLVHGGVAGWWRAVDAPGAQAPLTGALASLLFCLTGPHVIAGFLIPLFFGAACIVVTFWLGAALDIPVVGVLAALLVASCPVIVVYSRSYHFSMSATFFATLALVAMVRSERFARLDWAAVFGVCVGLMPLARTMTLGFLPGLGLGVLIYVLAVPERRLARFLTLCGAGLLAVVIVGIWLLPNFTFVWDYLSSYAYGTQSLEYGPKQNFFNGWGTTIRWLINTNIYLPDFLLLCVGVFISVLFGLQALLRLSWPQCLARTLRSSLTPLLVFVVMGFMAINSTPNKGSAFFAPLIPAAFILLLYLPYYHLETRAARGIFSAAVALFAIGNTLPYLNLTWPIADQVSFAALGLIDDTVWDGKGAIQIYESDGGLSSLLRNEPVSPADGKVWMAASADTANLIMRRFGPGAIISLGFRNNLYNVNTLQLDLVRTYGRAFAISQIDPQVTGDSVAGYQTWLVAQGPGVCALLLSSLQVPGDFNPPVIRPMMVQAAQKAGFMPGPDWGLPDGEIITMWVPRRIPPNCRPVGLSG